MSPLTIAADDRTGAIETAGALVAAGSAPVPVTYRQVPTESAVAVIDLGSRHLSPTDAAQWGRWVELSTTGPAAHKVDSTLRGNWAHELVGRVSAGRKAIVLVVALPSRGRTCEGGIVRDNGVAVDHDDAPRDRRSPVHSSRPRKHLLDAGCGVVEGLSDAEGLVGWLPAGRGIALCDASTDADIAALCTAWAPHADRILLAGTSAVIGAGASALGADRAFDGRTIDVVVPPVLVVCGSLHPAARSQLATLAAHGHPAFGLDAAGFELDHAMADRGVAVLASPDPRTPLVSAEHAEEVAKHLALLARSSGASTIVVIGGDTTAALLGGGPVVVGGQLADLAAWCRAASGEGPVVIARPGAFGGADSLLNLVQPGASSR